MARSTPRVEGTVLVDRDGAASKLAVGSPAWYAWLEDATAFAFTGAQGSFTARKERSGQTGWYWKAYRRHKGTLHRAYLGKSADLNLERLILIASELAGRTAGLSHKSRTVASPIAVDTEKPRQPGSLLPISTV